MIDDVKPVKKGVVVSIDNDGNNHDYRYADERNANGVKQPGRNQSDGAGGTGHNPGAG